MLFDKQNLFSDAQAITATAASTNIIDLGTAGKTWHDQTVERDAGKGVPKEVRIQVTAAFNNLTSLAVALEADDDEAFGSPVVLTTSTIALADLVPGKVIPPMYLPHTEEQRYLRLNYTVTGADPTTGVITAGIVAGHQENH